jgi:hypothetical protein
MESKQIVPTPAPEHTADSAMKKADASSLPKEFGGSGKPEPTRYGDWEVNGRCVDF